MRGFGLPGQIGAAGGSHGGLVGVVGEGISGAEGVVHLDELLGGGEAGEGGGVG